MKPIPGMSRSRWAQALHHSTVFVGGPCLRCGLSYSLDTSYTPCLRPGQTYEDWLTEHPEIQQLSKEGRRCVEDWT